MEISNGLDIQSRVNEALGINTKQDSQSVDQTLFDSLLDSLVAMEETQVDAKTQVADVLMGRSDDSHGALIALQKAELQMSFASAARDKVVQGVNQLLNMQI